MIQTQEMEIRGQMLSGTGYVTIINIFNPIIYKSSVKTSLCWVSFQISKLTH